MSAAPDGSKRLRVLALARSFPNGVLPTLGLWTERPARHIARLCDLEVVSPVPYCPPLPAVGPLRQYARFRSTEREEERHGMTIHRPRFLVGPGSSLHHLEHRTYYAAVRPVADRRHGSAPFDLIHAHFVYPDGVAASRLAERYGIPFLVTDQAPWFPWLEHTAIRAAAVPAARSAAALTCVSSYLSDTMRRYLDPSIPIEIIPNGVDEHEFEPPALPVHERSEQILFVGFINFNKGVDTLLAAMERVVARRPDARLVLVGGTFYRKSRLEEERLRTMARQSPVAAQVTFAGQRGPAEVAQLMRESSVVVLPSRAETFGAVLVEALASGTPVVATRSGGPEDFVTDEVGRLVPVGDPDALGEALTDVLEHRARYDADALRRFALDRFRWSSIAERYVELYERVLSRPGLAAARVAAA